MLNHFMIWRRRRWGGDNGLMSDSDFSSIQSKENGDALVECYKNYKINESRFFRSNKFNKDGSESTETIDQQEAVFLFECDTDKIQYNNSGRICYMEFNCVLNEHQILNP